MKDVPVLVVENAWHVALALKSTLVQTGLHVVGPTASTAYARRLVAEQRPKLAIAFGVASALTVLRSMGRFRPNLPTCTGRAAI